MQQPSVSIKDGVPHVEPIEATEVMEKVRREIGQYVSRTSRYGRSLRSPIPEGQILVFNPPSDKPQPQSKPSSGTPGVGASYDEAMPGSLERLVLVVGVEARRDRGVGMPQPLGDDRQRHAAQVQRGAARVTGVM
jgi:hypothetical protein